MAPDLNAISSEKWDYSTPGSAGYDVAKVTYDDPKNRPLRVLSIGAGFSGIMNAYHIQKHCENVEHVIYEKNHDLGGTWLENRYPGAACDIPSHAYTMNFALNPDWPRFFSYSPDIHKYLCKITDVFDLRKLMNFNHKVIEARWDEDKGRWIVKMERTKPDGSVEPFEDEGDLLLYGTGILNDFKWPDIKGIEKFKGKLVHTARWPENYQAEQWKDDTVAVIGSGASSIQTVPNMINNGVKHMDVFVRTGVWFVEIANNHGANHAYTDEQKEAFRSDPKNIVEHAKSIEQQVNGLWGTFYDKSEGQLMAQDMLKQRMAEFIKDERLLKGFTPKFAVGCRRITPGDPYMKAIQKPNVDVHFTHVTEITGEGLIGADGIERKVDTIVCATGFDVSYKPRFPVIGKNGVNLQEKWAVSPEGYLGLGVPDFPNFIMMIGPTWPVENGAVVGPLLGVSEYMIQIVKKMQKDDIKTWMPKQDVTDAFNEHTQEWVKHTVWKDDCRSWYKDNNTGRVNAVWPGSSLHYMDVIDQPRYEDFEITYRNKRNMWASLGIGYSMKDLNKNISPYLQVENIDPKWLAAVGSPVADPTRKTPIGAWRPHNPPEEKKVVPVQNAPLTDVAQKTDDFPDQSAGA